MYAVTSKREIEDVKSHLRTTWMAGDYDRFSRYMENEARAFYERLRVPPGSKLLDVACGSGQLALFVARELVRVCVCPRRNDCDGELDGRRLHWRDVQGDWPIHRSINYSFTAAVGR